jgi:hypothetical protein
LVVGQTPSPIIFISKSDPGSICTECPTITIISASQDKRNTELPNRHGCVQLS